MEPLLSVSDLGVSFRTEEGDLHAVRGVSFDVRPGEVVAVVGESGSGKSVMAMTLLGLTRSKNAFFSGTAYFAGTELITASERELRRIRASQISMIFQNPMTALNPVQRVGKQIVEQIRAHGDVSRNDARRRAVELMELVGIGRADARADSFPHEFSGGMRQRVMIAMALSCSPQILIADEPTTALDVTIQAQILAELDTLRRETGVAIILITHDLGVVAGVADRVLVMYGGKVCEQGSTDEIFLDPQHPYTWALLGAAPRLDLPRPSRLATISGVPPSMLYPPLGCQFAERCPHSATPCRVAPALVANVDRAPDHYDRCWMPLVHKRRLRLVDGRFGLCAKKEDGWAQG